MKLSRVLVNGYRSVRRILMPVEQVSILVGANGVGKTNLYRGLALARGAATGSLALDIAREGGLDAMLWGGRRKDRDQEFRLVLDLENESTGLRYTYAIRVGHAHSDHEAAFRPEARIREETLHLHTDTRSIPIMERDGAAAFARDGDGRRVIAAQNLMASETALSVLGPEFVEVRAVRSYLVGWRFYHGFRTDEDSPLRRPSLSVAAPMLSPSGDNLAAVFATLVYVLQEKRDLHGALEAAFPRARLVIPEPLDQHTNYTLTYDDMPGRDFGPEELSDGTLQYLALMGALLSHRLPPFIALNEPENSLHPDLMPALAELIARASQRTQVWVVTHSIALAEAIAARTGAVARRVTREDGATWIDGLGTLGAFDADADD